jgi:allantoin racemase
VTAPESGGNILLLNPNSNSATTAMMEAFVRGRLQGTGYGVVSVTATVGPRMIVEPSALTAAGPEVLARARAAVDEHTVAIIVAAIGDPGVTQVRAEFAIPVVGIGEASVRAASANGRLFGMATSTEALAASLVALVEEHAGIERFTGLRLTESDALTLAADPARQLAELGDAVRRCQQLDAAEAVIIGGGPLSDSARALAALAGVTIVEPIPAAVELVLANLEERARSLSR